MSSAAENRQNFRMPLSGERQDGELRFENQRLKVRLLDESAGGFCAICEQLPDFEVGTKAFLLAGEDWYEVSVTNILPVKPMPIDNAADPAHEDSSLPAPLPYPSQTSYRIGLRRLGDAYDPDYLPTHSWAGLFCRLRHPNPNTMGMFAAGAVLALIVAFFPYFALKLATSDNPKDRKEERQRPKQVKQDDHISLGDNSLSKTLAATAANMPSESPKSANNSRPAESSGPTKLDEKISELRRTIQQLPGAMPFTLPEVVEQLKLTKTQQKRIRELIDSAANLIDSLDDAANPDDQGDASAAKSAAMNDALQSVFDLLDDQQKKKWSELTGEPEKKREKKQKTAAGK